MSETESYLLGGLENHLGKSHKTSHTNYAFTCPFCNHRKPKLEVNIKTSDKGENPFACWVCGVKGRKLSKLLRLLKVNKEEALRVLQYVKKGSEEDFYSYTNESTLELPKGYIPLWSSSEDSIPALRAKKYLISRGLTEYDIRKYQIGYAIEGDYADRVIIPSYNEFGRLEMYIGRSIQQAFITYLKPVVNTNEIVFFDNLINWTKPVIICEGVFDAIAIKRNAIPLLGKFARIGVKRRLIENRTPAVYIALDLDAKKEAVQLGEDLLKLGQKTYVIDIKEKDPGQIGTYRFQEYLKQAQELDTTTLLKYKLQHI
jgi:DNA primase